VAVRPPQAVSDADAQLPFVRDARAATPEGQRQLQQIGRELASRENAQSAWNRLDLTPLNPLAEGYAKILARYQALAPGDPAPDPATALEGAGLVGDTTELIVPAWNAFYTAEATGPDAGVRLETPTAALRILHFTALAKAPLPVADALTVLRAKPLIPQAVRDFVNIPAVAAPAPAPSPAPTPQMHALLGELADAQTLLDAARQVAPVPAHAAAPPTGERQQGIHAISLSTVPQLKAVLPAQRTTEQNRLLARLSIGADTPVPAATVALQEHVNTLTAQALDMQANPVFHTLVQTTSTNPALRALNGVFGPIKHLPGFETFDTPDVDMNGRIRPLGIGDLKVVKQTLLAYQPGEVAHIENVLKGESKNRTYRTLDRLTVTDFTSEETTTDNERDTQSTDRFELKKEADATIKEDMSVKAGLTVTGSYGPVTVTAQGDFAYSTSKDESTKTSANFGRDIVDRSISKIQKKTTTSRTTITFHETEETDQHGIDNSAGAGNVTGVYRWVDKKYRAQIYNYGKRLMLEFVVPEPAAFFLASQMGQGVPTVSATPPAPFTDTAGNPLTPQAFTPATYQIFASRYNAAGIAPPPREWLYISTSFGQDGIDNGHTLSKAVKDLVVPDGYRMYYYHARLSAVWTNFPHFVLQIKDDQYYVLANSGALHGQGFEVGTPPASTDPGPEGVVAVSVMGYDINAYTVNVSGLCSYMPQTYVKWQQDCFDKSYTAYKALKTEYDQKVQQAQAQVMGIAIEGRNPGINLDIIKRELKKHCLTMLTGMHFNDFHAMSNPSDEPTHLPEIDPYVALDEGRFIEFFEQAFEWEQITYLFYPYFWGRKSKWIQMSNLSDPDPAFMQFLQAGAARIVLPVSRAYDDAMAYFLQPRNPSIPVADRIWQGGEPPTIDDPLYRSIADELRAKTDDLAGALPEGDPWEFTVPTTLVWLQADSTLPVFE
jgi:hypothetical protein